jgi:hypothetical protein
MHALQQTGKRLPTEKSAARMPLGKGGKGLKQRPGRVMDVYDVRLFWQGFRLSEAKSRTNVRDPYRIKVKFEFRDARIPFYCVSSKYMKYA